MDASSFQEAVFQIHQQGRGRGHYFAAAQDHQFTDRYMHIQGRRLLSFGSCSYLGMEFDPRIIAGAVEAYRRYGSQTSFSRGYLSCPLYEELEADLFPKIFGVPRVLLLPSTSTAHHVLLPAMLDERDAAVCDHQAHRSVDDAVTLQCTRSNAKKVVIKHGELDQALETLARLSRLHQRVWFFCDGVYSMYGDYLPVSFLESVLAVAPNVHLYVDDAHGMSWAGKHGRGHFLARFPLNDRIVLVTSLAKAFATGGGVAVTTNSALLERARLVGGPFSFSGPLRPGDLGASIASAKIHLSAELPVLQARLHARVAQANALCHRLGIPLVIDNETPIRFIALGRPEAVFLMAELLRDDGYHVNVSGFPAVPSSRGGLRIGINAIHSEEQIDGLMCAIANRLPKALAAVGVTREEVIDQFYGVLPPFMRKTAQSPDAMREPVKEKEVSSDLLHSEVYGRMDMLNAKEWDATIGQHAFIDSASMRATEAIFHMQHAQTEYRWNCRYVLVRDQNQELQAAMPVTTCLVKDDTYMSATVSRALERARTQQPYLFTSKALVTGHMASEGQHVYLRGGRLQEAAFVRLVEEGLALMKAEGASLFVMGNFLEDANLAQTAKLLAGQGMVPVRLPDSHILELDWQDENVFITSLASRRRRHHVRELQEQSAQFRVEVWDRNHALDEASLSRLHALYMNLVRKNLRINIFPMPRELLRAHLESGAWEFLVLWHCDERHPLPVAWGAMRYVGAEARGLYCGVDYEGFDVHKMSPYRQLLWQVIRHAGQRGCRRIQFGMGADYEKDCFGTVATPTYAFARADNDYQAQQLQEFVSSLARDASLYRPQPDAAPPVELFPAAALDSDFGWTGPAVAELVR